MYNNVCDLFCNFTSASPANLNFYCTFMCMILKTNKMKQLVVILNLIILLFMSSCATQKQLPSNDDVYADPKEDRVEQARIAAVKKQAKDAEVKRYNDSIAAVKLAQQQKDDANPYYKAKEFKYDDYYDYEYATRVKRFDNNINGLGYYDNYYTNSYWYNKNPYNYGVSVYNGYSWWGQSYNNYSYNPSVSFYANNGWGNTYGHGGYNGYNPYDPYSSAYWQGYNNGFNNGYYGTSFSMGYGSPFGYGGGYGFGYSPYSSYGYNPYGYNPYGYGYGGYGGGYSHPSTGWGYFNGYDNNSSYTYGPRESHTGNNSHRTSNPGVNSTEDGGYSQKYISSVTQQHEAAPKFTELPNLKATGTRNSSSNLSNQNGVNGQVNYGNPNSSNPVRNGGIKNSEYDNNLPVRTNNGNEATPVRNYNSGESAPVKQDGNEQPVRQNQQPSKQYEAQPSRQYEVQPSRQYEVQPNKQYEAQPSRQYDTPARQNNNFEMPSNGGGGGGVRTAPSGGGGRPR